MEQVAQARSENPEFNIDETVKKSKNLSKVSYSFETNRAADTPETKNTKTVEELPNPSEPEPKSDEGSFFDSID